MLDVTQPEAQQAIRNTAWRFIRHFQPDLVKFDFGYDLPSLALAAPADKSWAGEKLLYKGLEVVASASSGPARSWGCRAWSLPSTAAAMGSWLSWAFPQCPWLNSGWPGVPEELAVSGGPCAGPPVPDAGRPSSRGKPANPLRRRDCPGWPSCGCRPSPPRRPTRPCV
jgi:hypothetical protein